MTTAIFLLAAVAVAYRILAVLSPVRAEDEQGEES